MNMNFDMKNTSIEGVKLITPFYCEDERGYFLKNYEKDVFRGFGYEAEIYEEFETYSCKNVIRGLHFQLKSPQIKFVRAIKGTIHDVIVDIRKDSKTFGQWESFELTDKNRVTLVVPAGFAHGFEVVSEDAVVSYKCIGKYLKGYDSGIVWNDSRLNINWDISAPIVSKRDSELMSFQDFCSNFGGLEV